MAIYTIPYIKWFSSASLLNTVLKILSVTSDAIFTVYLFEFETALSNSLKLFNGKKHFIKNIEKKPLNRAYFRKTGHGQKGKRVDEKGTKFII